MRRTLYRVPSYRAARRAAPWAAVIARCVGGYIAFESANDWRTWRRQR